MATEAEIQAFVNQPGVTDAQIAAAMQQFNVSPEQVAAAMNAPLSDIQSRYESAQAANQDYANRIAQAYQSVGITSPDAPGQQYWTEQLRSGAINPEDLQHAFLRAASGVTDPQYATNVAKAQELLSGTNRSAVEQAYQDVLGRAGDTEGMRYWTEQLQSGALTPRTLTSALAQAAVPVASTLPDRLAIQSYLGEDVYAPEEFLKRTGGLSYQDVVDYVSQNINDPTKIYQAAQQYNVNPNDIIAAMQAKSVPQAYTLSQVEQFFQQGQEGFADRYNQILDDTFGNDEEKARIEQILGLKAGDLEKLYDPSQFSRSSIEKIEETLQTGRVNKIQDALITKAVAKDLLGYSDDEMKTMVSDLVQGREDDPILRDIFDSLKSGNRLTKDEFQSLMIKAGKENPDSEVFKRNPELGARYIPVEPTQGVSGQYGYYNNAPVLNMSSLDRYLKDSNQSKLDLGEGDLGWATNSRYMGEVRNGAAVFGVKANKEQLNLFDKIEKDIQKAGGVQVRDGVEGIYVTSFDPETGQTYTGFQPINSLVSSDPESGRDPMREYQETRQQLEAAAQKLNIDPRQYSTTKELFNAVQDASKDLYLVVGRAQGWNPEIAKASGITVTDGSRGGVNHAAVLYQRFGDKGIALQPPQSFGFDDPKKKSFLQEIASIPFIAEAAMFIPGMQGFYPIIKGAQTAILGGDPGDILKNVALSYVGQSVLPQIAPEITSTIGNTLLEAGVSPDIAGTLAEAGARVAMNTGMSVLAGEDIAKAAERSLLTYGVNRGISGGLSLSDFPREYQPEVARMLSEAVLTGDIGKAASNAVLRFGSNELRSIVQNRTPTTGGPTLRAARGGLAQASMMQRPRRVAAVRRDVRKLIPLRKSGLSYIRT